MGLGAVGAPPAAVESAFVTDSIGWAEFPTRELRAGTDVQ